MGARGDYKAVEYIKGPAANTPVTGAHARRVLSGVTLT
jgi:hypothetical protein